ncbi:MAG TPA: diguanylate cyclase [Treponemataceae bacterium]|nr:diguanylate cyclase [Treponemataceae bacterium]
MLKSSLAFFKGFVLLLELTDKNTVKKIISRIEKNLDAWNVKSEKPFAVSLSAGFAVYNPDVHKGFAGLFKEADSVMFKEKNMKWKVLT